MTPLLWGVLVVGNGVAAFWFYAALVILSTTQTYLVSYDAGKLLFMVGGLVVMAAAATFSVLAVLSEPPGLGSLGALVTLVLALSAGRLGWNDGKRDPYWRARM